MLRYISEYVGIYNLYIRTKPIQYLSIKEIYLLPVLDARWETISIDFIVELLESVDFNVIITVVDLMYKITYL